MSGPHRLAGPARLDCDVLVIGSGAGGAVIASELANAGLDVVVLEEGPYVDAADAPDRLSASMRKLWRGGGLTAALGKPPVAYAEGRCVGGGTEINSAIFQRAPAALLDDWARRYGIGDFGADAMAPYYDKAAGAVNASVTDGPLGAPSDILREAGDAMGWQVEALERGQRSCVGTNFCSFGCPTGGKQSMTATLIPAALSRGARLIAECRVTKLLSKGRRIVGAKARATGPDGRHHALTVRAARVFLCAGAIHSPALLQRSGLGGGTVGRTLRLHPTIKVAALFDRDIDAQEHRLPLNAITEFMPELRLGGSVFQPSVFGMFAAEDWGARASMLGDWRRVAMYYAMVRAGGVGRIRHLPGADEPLVTYALTRSDRAALAGGLDKLVQAMFAAGAQRVVPSISGHPGWDMPPAEPLDLLPPGRTNLMTIHLFSSCPPGERRDLCATDSAGRVRGWENLHIADASLIPEAPGVNPQGTVMALAYRSAEMFLTDTAAAARRAALSEA